VTLPKFSLVTNFGLAWYTIGSNWTARNEVGRGGPIRN
jgi:hypothetical protein